MAQQPFGSTAIPLFSFARHRARQDRRELMASFVVPGRSTVMSNTIRLAQTNGGHIFPYRNSDLTGNSTDGAPDILPTMKQAIGAGAHPRAIAVRRHGGAQRPVRAGVFARGPR